MAVYTEISDDELDGLLGQYDLGQALSCKGIAEGVENSNFLLHTEVGYFILTLYEKRVHAEDLPFFLGLMEHLAAGGFISPRPISAKDGRNLKEVAGRPAAIIEFLDGRSVRRITPQHCALLGQTLAQLHTIGSDFKLQRANTLSVSNWRPLFTACQDSDHGNMPDDLLPEIEAEISYLEAHWPSGLPSGVIHADLFPDNIFFLNDRVSGVIDYYFACNDFFAYDLAICLNAWCFENDDSFNITKARKLLNGYREVRDFSQQELDFLPLLCRGAAVRFLLTRLFDWLNQVEGALVKPKDPHEYLKKLQFHQAVTSVAAYGLE
ncbi:homoserine kinase [uncultured Sneathiella sp.]|uniref:homoserine kinase n=1 Tax=uncultured Sneathiella sp. TaxID=879315 RepID=UPI0030ED97B4|tara:strand:+ start:7713 stop:8678 length:966 start_codon:yes stop_codon:yes gene_type:complete